MRDEMARWPWNFDSQSESTKTALDKYHKARLSDLVDGVGYSVLTKSDDIFFVPLIDQDAPIPIKWPAFPYFGVYLVTLVPFYHGALRHLDITYLEDPSIGTRPGALLADWGLLFLESCLLLGLVLLVQRPTPFCYLFIALLIFDVLWAFGAHLAFSAKSSHRRLEWRWGLINMVTALILILALIYFDTLDETRPIDSYRWRAFLTIAVARTIFDYLWCWAYYFPSLERSSDSA